MEIISCKELSFSYATSEYETIKDVSFSVDEGELCLLIGKSGAGKSTLLKLLKKEIAPAGRVNGEINTIDSVGYVSQNVEETIVCDKVRSELSFGLMNMGLEKDEIELLVAETAGYFNLSSKLDWDISRLSGGEKQILNLASVMIMKPRVLLLDEPTCQLDPVWAERFLNVIKGLNRDFGTTVLVAEHLLENLYNDATSVMLVENGTVPAKLSPRDMTSYLREADNELLTSLPVALRLFEDASTVSECRQVLKEKSLAPLEAVAQDNDTVMRLKGVYFAYEKNKDVLADLSLNVYDGKINAIIGANSSGKSTLLKVMSRVLRQHHGRIRTEKRVSMLCQNPFDLFTKDRCCDEVEFGKLTDFLEISYIRDMHPFDLSGGEAQRLALAKVLSTNADIILLDEPTKALDSAFKTRLAQLLKDLCKQGKTIVITSHDIDFVGEYADFVSFLSSGTIITTRPRAEFFSNMNFFSTSVSRITKGIAQGYTSLEDLKRGGVL